jgi:hypothetical protein
MTCNCNYLAPCTLTQSSTPVKSIATQGSSPTTQVLCPGGNYGNITRPPSVSDPSSIIFLILPETISVVCGTSQLFVLTLGFTCFSQFHPGSSVTLAIVTFPKFTISIFSFSNVNVSSGDVRLFFRTLDVDAIQVGRYLDCILSKVI